MFSSGLDPYLRYYRKIYKKAIKTPRGKTPPEFFFGEKKG
tara:strand:+ start:277 stop:396 length:120 start_codon:yes stop_codon:yes gene_type:complete